MQREDLQIQGKKYLKPWSEMNNTHRIAIVVISILFAALFFMLLGWQLQTMGFARNNYELIFGILNGSLDPAEPEIYQQIVALIVWLIIVLIILILDLIVNIWVLVAAMRRKEYPPPHDRKLWLIGLWTAFFAIQAPTGFPSALAYYWFIVRNARPSVREGE